MELFTDIKSFREWRALGGAKAIPESERRRFGLGFVPTMGALHEGHASLLRQSAELCRETVLSIYVNPSQFGPKEDLAKYPRTLDADLDLARSCGVSAVFCPSNEDLYPISTWVEENELTRHLCGPFRPGHFRGVTTIVLKLLNIVNPGVAFFGLKDAQQFFVLNKMAQDLNLTVEMRGVPTVREPDGLALSSRNRYLSRAERALASEIFRVLRLAKEELLGASGNAQSVLDRWQDHLSSLGFKVQYLELCDLPHLKPAKKPHRQGQLLAVAAYLGSTRLIDNIIW